jgi:hypothetical protein
VATGRDRGETKPGGRHTHDERDTRKRGRRGGERRGSFRYVLLAGRLPNLPYLPNLFPCN